MYKTCTFLLISLFTLFIVSCKNEVKDQENTSTEKTEITEVKKAEKKELTADDFERINSVMSRLMATPELKKYTSFVVTAGLTEVLAQQKGPYTVLAPSNAAFDSLDVEKTNFYLNPKNKEKLVNLLKSHIVEGNIDSAVMLQDIKKHSGRLMMKTLSGGSLTASTKQMDIVITDEKGNKALIVKSDINGSNGVIHVLNAVLNVD